MSKLTMAVTIVTIALVFAIGYVCYDTVVDNISGPTTSQHMNATMSTGNTVFSITGTILVVGTITVILGFLFYWVSSPERFKKPNKLLRFLGTSCYYFGFGSLGLGILAVPSYLIWFLYNYTVVEGNTGPFVDVIKWIPVGLLLFFAIAGFGYLFKKKFIDKLSLRLKEVEYKENLEEIPKV